MVKFWRLTMSQRIRRQNWRDPWPPIDKLLPIAATPAAAPARAQVLAGKGPAGIPSATVLLPPRLQPRNAANVLNDWLATSPAPALMLSPSSVRGQLPRQNLTSRRSDARKSN